MIHPEIPPLAAGVRPSRLHWRRRHRPGLLCEALEDRQLLSTLASQVPGLSQITAQPALDAVSLAASGPTGLTPLQIRNAYGVSQIKFKNGTVGGYGQGQTIAIVTAYHDPNIVSDLSAFDRQFSLPDPWSFTVKNLGGNTSDSGWALETALDVEWAHALAPGANILLVEAASSSLSDLFNAVSYASSQPGVGVVSMSWGTNEFWGEWGYDSLFTTPSGHTGVTYVAASGDSGAWSGPMYPSSSPNVLAVGGTTLNVTGSGGTYVSEAGWNGSTGGYSGYDAYWRFYERAPSYQVAAQAAVGINYGVRTTPDVAFNADPNTGVTVYDSLGYGGQSGWFQIGGTSAGAPAWAGLIAIADQGLALAGKGTLSGTQALGQLYALPSSDYHDVTSGTNGYSARSGYDLVTGLGSPKANLVIAGLLSANGASQVASTSQAVATATKVTTAASGSRFVVTVGSTTQASGSLVTTSSTTTVVQAQALLSTSTSVTVQPSSTQPAVAVATSSAALVPTLTAPPAQSLSPSVGAVSSSLVISDETPRTDVDAPVEAAIPVPSEPPAPAPAASEEGPATDPAPAAEPPATPPPVDPSQPMEPSRPADEDPMTSFGLALAQLGPDAAAWQIRLRTRPAAALPIGGQHDVRPGPSATFALAGAVLLTAGGYRLVLGRPDRIRRRWASFRLG